MSDLAQKYEMQRRRVRHGELDPEIQEVLERGALVLSEALILKKMRARQLREDEVLFAKLADCARQLGGNRTYFSQRSLQCGRQVALMAPLVEEMQKHVDEHSELDGRSRVLAEIASLAFFNSRKSPMVLNGGAGAEPRDETQRRDYHRMKAKEQYSRVKELIADVKQLQLVVSDPEDSMIDIFRRLDSQRRQLEMDEEELAPKTKRVRASRKNSPVENARNRRLLKEYKQTLKWTKRDLALVRRDISQIKIMLDTAMTRADRRENP